MIMAPNGVFSGQLAMVSSAVRPESESFERAYRILNGDAYKAVFENRKRLHGKFFSFHAMPNGQTYHRLGLAVSRKVSKKAVERNRIKRQLRESFRQFQAVAIRDEQLQGIDIVVVAKPAAAVTDNGELRHEIDTFWIKAINKCA